MFFRSKKKQETKIPAVPPLLPPAEPTAEPVPTKVSGATSVIGAQLKDELNKTKVQAGIELDKTLGMAIRVLSQPNEYNGYQLKDLGWFLFPALQRRQFIIAQGKRGPAGLVLWANVSDEVDARFRDAPNQPLRLEANEWQSGQHYWVIAAVGEDKVIRALLGQLSEGPFKGRSFCMRVRNNDGTYRIISVKTDKEQDQAGVSARQESIAAKMQQVD